jgi:hypothetical protein
MLVFHGAAATVARVLSDYERLAEVLLCASMHASHETHGHRGSRPSCRSSPKQQAAVQRLLSYLDRQRHSGTLFNTQAWVTCAEAAMRITVELRLFSPKRLHHVVVAKHICERSP